MNTPRSPGPLRRARPGPGEADGERAPQARGTRGEDASGATPTSPDGPAAGQAAPDAQAAPAPASPGPPRGKLTVYLGAAPGVGKTFAMLAEAHRRAERGTDVVVGLVETHGRAQTQAMIEGLPVLARLHVPYRGAILSELDTAAVIRRHPEVVLVDELAHTNAPGLTHPKRWQDVEDILAAGIDVITTVNVQHLQSLGDVVAAITGVRQRETVPDDVVRRAEQIQLVDMTPEALRRRLAHGNVYAPERIDAALSSYFRVGNLTALRELALLWLADRVDAALEQYRATHNIAEIWPARERIVVAVTGGADGETLIRRAARIAQRGPGADLMALHVVAGDGLRGAGPDQLAAARALVEQLGGTFHTVVGQDTAQAIVDFATGANATMVVVGVSRRTRLSQAMRGSVGDQVARIAGALDVHLVSHPQARAARSRRTVALSLRRRVAGWVVALAGTAGLVVAGRTVGHSWDFSTMLLGFFTLSVLTALVGGLWPAITGAVAGALALNFFFADPRHTFTMADPQNVASLIAFTLIAGAVAVVVDMEARRTVQAARARAEAETLAALTQAVLHGAATPRALVEELRETFGVDGVELYARQRPDDPWTTVAASGNAAPTPAGASDVVTAGSGEVVAALLGERAGAPADAWRDAQAILAVRGRALQAYERRVLEAFATQMMAVFERRALRKQAAASAVLERTEQTRTALLAAVSHDLRTPMAAIRAGLDGLADRNVTWSEQDRRELLSTVDDGARRLERLIDNLLDLSRLQTGAVRPVLREVSIEEVVPAAVEGFDPATVRLDIPEGCPLIRTDPGLLERIVANITTNALRYSPSDVPVEIRVSFSERELVIRVIDRGPGIPQGNKADMFEPFQRLGDDSAGGLGLGLAAASGLAEAIGVSLRPEDTPGGGLTMEICVPLHSAGSAAPPGNGSSDDR